MATRKSSSPKATDRPAPEEAIEAGADPGWEHGEALPQSGDEESAFPATSAGSEGKRHPRFHFFIIDAGWKSSSAQVVRENFHMIRAFLDGDPLYVLSREQSIALIRANPDLVGRDPVILVHDLHAKGGRGDSGYHGFRLCLGLIKDGREALAGMQKFLRFVHFHRNSPNIEKDIKERLHRKGLEGAIEVLRAGSQELVGG